MSITDTLVVTPTLGDRDSLDRTIRSVREIGGSRVKHVITAPRAKCAILKQKYPTLEFFPEPEGCTGIYMALNHVINEYIEGYKYVTYINDDDYWLPNFTMLFDTIRQKDVDVVYAKTVFVDATGIEIGEQTSSCRYKDFEALLTQNIVLFTQQATLQKSKLFVKLKGFDETYKLVADTKYWIEAIKSGATFHYENIVCAAYTIQEGQLSSDRNLQNKEHIRLLSNTKRKFSSILKKYRFRFTNIKIYITRFNKRRK